MKTGWMIGLLVILAGLTACKKDNYHYPDATTDLVEGITDSHSQLARLRLDNGKEYPLTQVIPFKDSTPDSTYRLRCTYLTEGEQVTVYAASTVVSPHPVTPEFFQGELLTDPVKVTSVWLQGGYLNLHLGVLTHNDAHHKFHFIQEQSSKADGHQRFVILLYHDQNQDQEAYTQETFLSCPLSTLSLQPGDSLYMRIHSYDGWKQYEFEYPKP